MADVGAIFIMDRARSIGAIVPDVVVREVQNDFLRITDHPVEKGAAISDHAFKVPSEIEMRVGFSNSTGGSETYVDEAYEAFLVLQKKREPFSVVTGKRAYKDMLISAISVETDQATEHALIATIGLREVIITSTQTTAAASKSPDDAKQAAPETTGSIKDGGTRSLSPTMISDGNGGQTVSFDTTTKINWSSSPSSGSRTPIGGSGVTRAAPAGGWSMVGAFK